MADDEKYFRPDSGETLPRSLQQNPAPVVPRSQEYLDEIRSVVELMLRDYLELHTPSNYVSQITGPHYTLQFQAIAEQISLFTIMAEQAALDGNYKFTRSEFLWQVIGTYVLPDTSNGIFRIPGDVSYRCFLEQMFDLLLNEATAENNQTGLQLLTNAVITVLEKNILGRDTPGSIWANPEFRHEFEINVEGKGRWTITNPDGSTEIVEGELGTGFPENPFLVEQFVSVLKSNADLVLGALKPAHALFEYRHLFRDALESLEDEPSFEADVYYYDDLRKWCHGCKELVSDNGETLTDRTLFSDVTLDFKSVRINAPLRILSGPNASPTNGGGDDFRRGEYCVIEKLRFPVGADSTPREYTSSPSGLTGEATFEDGGILNDPNQDWSNAEEGEVVTFADGPNAGKYRLDTLIGTNGGLVGEVSPGSGVTQVRVAVSLLRVDKRMPEAATGQSYTIEVDRLGVRVPMCVEEEDVSAQFYL